MKIDKSRFLFLAMLFFIFEFSCGNKHVSIRNDANPDVAYFCPMDSMINEATPGHCTVCGMNLIKNPKYAGEELNTVVVTSTGDTLSN